MKRSLILVMAAALAALIPLPLAAEPIRFAFAHHEGDRFRALSTVDESVYLNHRFLRRAQILNRITYEVTEAAPDGSWGHLRGSFETSEKAGGDSAYLITESYASEFIRDRLGHYTIEGGYFMPVVRDVPSFPDRELAPGEAWTAHGEERHDFRRAFGISEPYVIPLEVSYRFEGPVRRGDRELLLIRASYTVFVRPAEPASYTEVFPVQIAGFSEQRIFWDKELGQPSAYEERFDLSFDWSDGSNTEYRGSASSELLESPRMDREALKDEIERGIEGLEDVSVVATSEGVSISLEDIGFEPDSARLEEAELAKVARIAELLKRYPGRDILVTGHSAAAGYAPGRLRLSEERARAVAGQLVALGARSPERVRATGRGDTEPLADNSTEAGRARNRRVVITLLEN